MTMQVTETSAEGLKREFTVTVPADEITDSANERFRELSQSVNLPGFRPGKVPTSVLRQRYGDAVRGEVLERTIQQSWQKALEEREIRPASEPKIEIVTFEDGKDLEYKLAVELMPDIDDFDLSKVELERLVVPVSDEEIDKSLERLAANKKEYEASEGYAAEDQDQILMDFKGTVEGKEFPGSNMEGFELVLGQGGFLPGFEEQLVGVQAGEKKQVTLTMPEDFDFERGVQVVDANADRAWLEQRDTTFIDEYNLDRANNTGTPRYYANWDENTLILAPTPNAAITVELWYNRTPERLGDGTSGTTTTTFVSNTAPEVLIYSTVAEAFSYLKNPTYVQLYEQKYNQAVQGLATTQMGRKRRDEYADGVLRVPLQSVAPGGK